MEVLFTIVSVSLEDKNFLKWKPNVGKTVCPKGSHPMPFLWITAASLLGLDLNLFSGHFKEILQAPQRAHSDFESSLTLQTCSSMWNSHLIFHFKYYAWSYPSRNDVQIYCASLLLSLPPHWLQPRVEVLHLWSSSCWHQYFHGQEAVQLCHIYPLG